MAAGAAVNSCLYNGKHVNHVSQLLETLMKVIGN